MIRALSASLLLLLLAALPVAASEDLVPDAIGGAPAQVSASSGLDLVATLDPTLERDRGRIDQLETLLAVTGQPVSAVSVASAYPAAGTSGGWVIALRVAGAEEAVLGALVLSSVRDDLGAPSQEAAEVGDKSVIRVSESGTAGDHAITIYGRDDTVWLIGGTDADVASVLESLP